MGPYRAIQGYIGPYRTIQGYIGPYGALWGRDPHVLCWQSPWLLSVWRSFATRAAVTPLSSAVTLGPAVSVLTTTSWATTTPTL